MKPRNHIDTKIDPTLYRCKSVWLCGGTMKWELDSASPYKPMEFYKDAPHRQFMQASDDDAIEAFVRAWGPLWIDWLASPGESSLPQIRKERDTLIAWVRLFAALKKPDYLRDAVISLLQLEPDPYAMKIHTMKIRLCLGLPAESEPNQTQELEDQVRTASRAQIADVCDYLVESFPTLLFGQTLRIARTRTEASVQATVGLRNLQDALHWMVWQDIFSKTPFWFCDACHKLIESETLHKRRFCNPKCATKLTGGDWVKAKRKDPVWREKHNEMRRLRDRAKARAANRKPGRKVEAQLLGKTK